MQTEIQYPLFLVWSERRRTDICRHIYVQTDRRTDLTYLYCSLPTSCASEEREKKNEKEKKRERRKKKEEDGVIQVESDTRDRSYKEWIGKNEPRYIFFLLQIWRNVRARLQENLWRAFHGPSPSSWPGIVLIIIPFAFEASSCSRSLTSNRCETDSQVRVDLRDYN